MKPQKDLSTWRALAALSVPEVSEVTGLSPATVHRMIQARQLESVRIGRRVLIRPAEIERILKEGKSSGA